MLSIGQVRPDKLRRGDRLAAFLYGSTIRLFSLLGPRFTFAVFRRFMLRSYLRSRPATLIRRNIDLVYADKSAGEREELVTKVAREQVGNAAELMLQDHWRRSSLRWTRHNLDADWLQPYVRNEKPALLILGHFAGWEANAMTLSRYFENVMGIYAPPKNPLLESYFRERRAVKGASWVYCPRDLPDMRARIQGHLGSGGSMLYLLDAPLPGPMLPFLDRESPTTLGPYTMAARAGIPLLPVYCGRDREGVGFWIEVQKPIYAEGRDQAAVIDFATRMNGVYSDWIRANPDQWYWTANFFRPNARWEAKRAAKAKRSKSSKG